MSKEKQLEKFLDRLNRNNRDLSKKSIERIKHVFSFAYDAHISQKRVSGESYIVHPIEVALLVASWNSDEITISSALLHDVIEDTDITYDEIRELFGEKIAEIVDGLTKITHIKTDIQSEKNLENYRKLIFALSKDFRVIVIKFADRLHNLKTIHYLREEKQKRIALESLEIYAPLANRLGMNSVKSEIEDLSFKILHREEYSKLKELVGQKKVVREEIIQQEITKLTHLLSKQDIKFEIFGRAKHFYSIYKKIKKGKSFKDIYDVNGIRILTDTVEDCYKILGIIHQNYTPIAERFKDFIAIPKFNNYQSLHTTYINSDKKFIEVQIRTKDMNIVAEYGIAAHFIYKEDREKVNEFDKQISLLRELINVKDFDPDDAYNNFKKELFKNEIYVFTPNGDIKFLPSGSTVLDFAYYIHSDVGMHARAGVVNGKFVKITYKLKNGDTVRIETSPTVFPVEEWLKVAKTIRATTKIRNYLKHNNREEYISKGKLILKNYFSELTCSDSFEHTINKFLKNSDISNLEELYYKIGSNSLKKERIFTNICKNEDNSSKSVIQNKKRQQYVIEIEGIKNFAHRIAKCCNPIPGDEIVAVLSKNSSVAIHNKYCKTLKKSLGTRNRMLLDANWVTLIQNSVVKLRLEVVESVKNLSFIQDIFKKEKAEIREFNYRIINETKAVILVVCVVRNREHLKNLINKLQNSKNVYLARRII